MAQQQILVIGGGPAGLMAAGRAAEAGAGVILLEKMDHPGRKLGMTGGGRCNFTNTAPLKEFIARFGPEGPFLYQAFSRFFTPDLIGFLDARGIRSVTEEGGRVFPENGSAREVLYALLKWVRAQGVKMLTEARVEALVIEAGRVKGVKISRLSPLAAADRETKTTGLTQEEIYPADAVIIATGGASYPSTGSTGDGYQLAESAGHTLVPIRPALVPLVTEGAVASKLQGVSLQDVTVRIWIDGKKQAQRDGEMLFTHFGVSGPIVLSLSKLCVDALHLNRKVSLAIDLQPHRSESELDAHLQRELDVHGKQHFGTLLNGLLPRKLVSVCSELTEISTQKLSNQITAQERKRLGVFLKDFRLEVTGHKSFREAMITAGGVDLREVDPRTMGSRLVKGLYFAGEVLNLDADTGGFNLQAAFSTGWVAGEASAKEKISDETLTTAGRTA